MSDLLVTGVIVLPVDIDGTRVIQTSLERVSDEAESLYQIRKELSCATYDRLGFVPPLEYDRAVRVCTQSYPA
jgi:hypothetical protein